MQLTSDDYQFYEFQKLLIENVFLIFCFKFSHYFYLKDDQEGVKEEDEEEKKEKLKQARTEKLSLDRYCVKFTSEDNESFQKLHRFTEEKKKEEYAYLYAQQEEGDRRCTEDAKEALRLKGRQLTQPK